MLKQPDLDYLGGIIDGEASLLITKRGFRYDIVFSISMTDSYPIKLISEEFNLPFHITPQKSKKTLFVIHTQAKKCASFLKIMLPHIRLKKKECMLLLALQLLRENKQKFYVEKNRKILFAKYGPPRSIPNKVLGEEFFIRADALYKRCRAIKRVERIL